MQKMRKSTIDGAFGNNNMMTLQEKDNDYADFRRIGDDQINQSIDA